MKTIGKFLFALVMLAASVGFSAPRASAESLLSGNFKLPMQAHWGMAVLPAGDYSFTVELHSSGPIVAIRYSDGKCAGYFYPRSVTTVEESGNQTLKITHVGNDAFVSTFKLGSLGLSLDYNVPKDPVEMAQTPSTSMIAARK